MGPSRSNTTHILIFALIAVCLCAPVLYLAFEPVRGILVFSEELLLATTLFLAWLVGRTIFIGELLNYERWACAFLGFAIVNKLVKTEGSFTSTDYLLFCFVAYFVVV